MKKRNTMNTKVTFAICILLLSSWGNPVFSQENKVQNKEWRTDCKYSINFCLGGIAFGIVSM